MKKFSTLFSHGVTNFALRTQGADPCPISAIVSGNNAPFHMALLHGCITSPNPVTHKTTGISIWLKE